MLRVYRYRSPPENENLGPEERAGPSNEAPSNKL
jgi:hypothetical protein